MKISRKYVNELIFYVINTQSHKIILHKTSTQHDCSIDFNIKQFEKFINVLPDSKLLLTQ